MAKPILVTGRASSVLEVSLFDANPPGAVDALIQLASVIGSPRQCGKVSKSQRIGHNQLYQCDVAPPHCLADRRLADGAVRPQPQQHVGDQIERLRQFENVTHGLLWVSSLLSLLLKTE